MRTMLALTMVAAASLGSALPLRAQTVVGTWQAAFGGQRGVIKITQQPSGKLHGEAYYPGQERSGNTLNGNPISTISVQGRHVHFDFDGQDVTYDGDLSADGNTLAGTSTRGGQSISLAFERATDKTAWVIDPSPHKVLFVPVEKDVRLEVLDWGGSGPPLIFLPGLGNTAHVFDGFAPKFTDKHHVYAITRRGFGLSSKPTPTDDNYDADRLGDDVLAVIDALKLNRPVIAGHSLAGEELSSIGTRHPEHVSGLIYLDASYTYAFYDSGRALPPSILALDPEISTVRRDMLKLPTATPSQMKLLIQEIQATMPRLQTELQLVSKTVEGAPDGPSPSRQTLGDEIMQRIHTSERKYMGIKGSILAIVAAPHACGAMCDAPQVKAQEAEVLAQTDAFEAGTPQAHVVRIAQAQHYVFLSNEADVIREMNAFMDGLH